MFHLSRAGIEPGDYTIQLLSNGLGVYWEGQPYFNAEEAVGSHKISFSESTVRKTMTAVTVVKDGKCETHIKNIAQTGRKTMTFSKEGASIHCEFNFSDDDRLNTAVTAFEAIAETMQFGPRLEHLHRYDRLGLDAEIDSLTSEAQAGRAIELQNIAPALQSIFEDERVMERVRRKAGRLLQQAGVAPASDSSPR